MGTQSIITPLRAATGRGRTRPPLAPRPKALGVSPLLTDPPAHRAGNGGMGLSILGGDGGGGQTPVNVGGRARTVLQLIVAGDPLDLTGFQVRAHSKGKAGHRSGV